MEEADLEEVRNLHNEESTLNRLSDPFHVSHEEQLEWFRTLSASRKNRRYVLILKKDNSFVGIVRMDQLDLVNRSAFIGADIAPKYRRQGLAFEAYNRIINYIFGNLGLLRLQLETLVTNTEAVALYKKLGFQVEGTLRGAIFRDGLSMDLYVMGLLSHEWQMLEQR
jgi:ribosomal-protein-alanine N-acetyltransferase